MNYFIYFTSLNEQAHLIKLHFCMGQITGYCSNLIDQINAIRFFIQF